jgi:hypothetical protein
LAEESRDIPRRVSPLVRKPYIVPEHPDAGRKRMPRFETALQSVLSYRAAVRRYAVVPAGSESVPRLPYNAEVEAFFAALAEFLHLWVPLARDFSEDSRDLRDDLGAVAAAPPEQVKALLTFLWRGERFRDGFWGAQLQSGLVAALLDRLHDLHQAGEITTIETGDGG